MNHFLEVAIYIAAPPDTEEPRRRYEAARVELLLSLDALCQEERFSILKAMVQ